jgi:CRP-like cAMP-binding protein
MDQDAPSREALAAELRKVDLFSNLGQSQLSAIASIVRVERHAKGETLFRTGDPSDRIFVVLEGQVRIGRDLQGLGEEALAILGPGSVFGELSIVDPAPRSADAVIHESVRLAVIERDAMEDAMLMDRSLGYELLWNMARTLAARLRDTNDRVFLFASCARFG